MILLFSYQRQSVLKSPASSVLSIPMLNLFVRFMHYQKGYTQMGEGRLSSESEDVYPLPGVTSRRSFDRTELVSRFLCGLMFVGGTLMLSAASYVKQSDKDCAAQLSIWCKYEGKSPN